MNPPKQDPAKQEAILKHALRRFLKHGVRRTAISDIAKDVSLPTSAIAMFYKDKETLVTACFDRMLRAHKREAKKIVESNLDARGKLRIYLLNRFYAWREIHNSTPHSIELASILLRVAPDRVTEEEDLLIETLEKILVSGQAMKTFRIEKGAKSEALIVAKALSGCFPLAGLRRPRQIGEKELLEILDWLLLKWRRPGSKEKAA